jgi:hypothetical protein
MTEVDGSFFIIESQAAAKVIQHPLVREAMDTNANSRHGVISYGPKAVSRV